MLHVAALLVSAPIAAIGDTTMAAIVAGAFGTVHLLLVDRIRRDGRATRRDTHTTKQILDRREDDEPPPDHRYKRSSDS